MFKLIFTLLLYVVMNLNTFAYQREINGVRTQHGELEVVLEALSERTFALSISNKKTNP